MSPDIVTEIGVAGCALMGPILTLLGLRDMWQRRNSPERIAELERMELAARRWTGYKEPAAPAASTSGASRWSTAVAWIRSRREPAQKEGTSRPSHKTS